MASNFIYPKPKDWNSFEDIVCDLFARRFSCRNMQRYGRNGQTQYGVDIVGVTRHGLVGIQCAHYPDPAIPLDKIDEDIEKSRNFRPQLNEYWIATSTNRDTITQSHVLVKNEDQSAKGDYPLQIIFWETIVDWLSEYPDLVYKHFTKYFPIQELENLRYSTEDEIVKTTVSWPTTSDLLKDAVASNLADIPQVTPYQMTIGLTNFLDVNFSGYVDLEIQIADLMGFESQAESNFQRIGEILNEVRAILHDRLFSRELWISLNANLSVAFLFGWTFRRVTQFKLRLMTHGQVWSTDSFPYVPPDLIDDLPIILNNDSNKVVVILNITRDIESSVIDFVKTWEDWPRAILVWNLQNHFVRNSAHASSLAIAISQKLKSLNDRGGVSHIHLFAALPAPLATLIMYHLNAICPISLYFLDNTRTQYLFAGTISNNL